MMLNPLDLNLASRPIRNNTLLWGAHVALAVVVVGGTIWNVSSYVRHGRDLKVLSAERDSFESRMADLKRRENTARRGVARYDLKELNLRANKASDVIERKALSWTRLFNQMEKVLPYEVKMASIRPVFTFSGRARSGRDKIPEGKIPVSVEGWAKTLEAFFEFERALFHDPHFSQVEPHRFNRGDGTEVVFEMRFLYDPYAEPAETPRTDEAAAAVADNDEPEAESGVPPAPADGVMEEEPIEVEEPFPAAEPDDAAVAGTEPNGADGSLSVVPGDPAGAEASVPVTTPATPEPAAAASPRPIRRGRTVRPQPVRPTPPEGSGEDPR
jgi:hypothetical protein